MDFPRPSVSPSNIIGDIKDRFGFGGSKQRSYDEGAYYDEYDDYGYDDADPYGQEDAYASSTQADPYDRLEYTTRTTAPRPSRTSSYSTSPHLVSSEDIRATTSAYGVSTAATTTSFASSRSASTPTRQEATTAMPSVSYGSDASAESEQYDVPATSYTDFVSPYKEHANQSSVSASSHSAGLDSLFTPSAGSDSTSNAYSATSDTQSAGSTSYSREITLLQPVKYDDVASVARSVKLGNIVVLSLRSTDAALSKRVLDFSFGVASALDAHVDCIAQKTFVIVQGRELSLEEKHRLQKQGILQTLGTRAAKD